MAYFATEYTIRFDDTMAYGSHHFLTAFKFQCAARESFLFGERVFDVAGVREALDHIHLLTADAYARSINPAQLGDRLVILLTLEEWARASARFCYRVLGEQGQPICAGFQTLICTDTNTGEPTSLPHPLQQAMDAMREIEEPTADESFRDRVLAGGSRTDSLFGQVERNTAIQYLSERYPSPQVITAVDFSRQGQDRFSTESGTNEESIEAWVFSGQGSFDPGLLSERVLAYLQSQAAARAELNQCAAIAEEWIGGNASALFSGSIEHCALAARDHPDLLQVAIFLQNVLGARIRESQGYRPSVLMGHSFGEIAAFCVGGCFDVRVGIRIVCERVRAIKAHAVPGGELLAVASNRRTVATEAALLGLDQVAVAGRNHENQTIASGPHDQLNRLRDYLQRFDISSTRVPSPTAFHHPQLRNAAQRWLEQLRRLQLTGPSKTVYSPIGRRFISQQDDIALTLASQFLRPFDLQGAVLDVIDAGVNRFIDCGSSGSLAKLVAKAGPDNLDVCGVDLRVDSLAPNFPKPMSASTAPSSSKEQRVAIHRKDTQPVAIQQSKLNRRVIPPVAIVGQGCILPAGACSPSQLFSAINEQRSGIVDQRRYDQDWSEDFYSEKLVPDRSTSHLTGRVNDEDIVVPPNVDPNVFAEFTRAQKLLCIALAPCISMLEEAESVLCLIGATADGFADQDEVSSLRFVGIDPTDPEVDARMNTARSAVQEPHDAVQEVFDRVIRPGLQVTLVDAACASSLYTVALGMQALESNQTDAVIAGGVFCPGPGNSCLFSQFQGFTSTGCRPFDANADGVVFSEGSALVALRRVNDAERLSLPIAAVVRGAGLSSDGKSSSANVPQTTGQILSLERCYKNYDIDPASVQAIEGHGTSTPVGDATELETLRRFFAGKRSNPIPVHSLKGLLGHAGWAAGSASLIAACEYLRTGVFPLQAHHKNPSNALFKSRDTLTVPIRPVSLPAQNRRIAIDGFGFGGANAHLVLDAHQPDRGNFSFEKSIPSGADAQLVFVAFHEVIPTISSPTGLRFDRDSLKTRKGHMLLPDLADDMDISQSLAIAAVEETIFKIAGFDDALRGETSIVMAHSGKTERGVEATMRVLAPRLRRILQGDRFIKAIDAAVDRVRPSGPYTLQCMMPNVAAGRAALQLDLHGPNFVVDAGANSFEAAMSSAASLLQSGDAGGTKLVIVTAIDANPWRHSPDNRSADEFAAAFAITTRQAAKKYGMKIISSVDARPRNASGDSKSNLTNVTTAEARELLTALAAAERPAQATRAPSSSTPGLATTSYEKPRSNAGRDEFDQQTETNSGFVSAESKFFIHHPIWIESPISNIDSHTRSRFAALLVIAPANREQLAQLVEKLPAHATRFQIVVVGDGANELVTDVGNSNVVSVNLEDEQETQSILRLIDRFEADCVVAIESVASWTFSESLASVTNNQLCEMLFLVAQCLVDQLKQGSVELWGLFLNAWKGVVHPASGAISGLLKSIHREIPAARVGTVCIKSASLEEAILRLLGESAEDGNESEIVFDDAVRLVRRFRRTTSASEPRPLVTLDSNSLVVATGGARGVTAVLMDAILRDYQCTVIALGRSPLDVGPPNPDDAKVEHEFYQRFIRRNPGASALEMKKHFELTRACWEANETIQRLSLLGGRVEYMVCDVTDREQVDGVIQRIATKYGSIDLLVHGAGVQKSKRLEYRRLAEFRETYSVKVGGLRNLVECCGKQFEKMVCAHVLSSAYSIFGNDGQHDYGAANETMDRLCGLGETQENVNWSSIAWLAWDGIGMTRGSEYRALAERRGLSGLDVQNGQRIFREVLTGRTESSINVPLSTSEQIKYQVRTLPPAVQDSTGPINEVSVKLSSIACLPFHKVLDSPTLPGAWIIDQMVHAGLRLSVDTQHVTAVTISDATFSRFVRLVNGQDPNFRVVAEETTQGVSVWLMGDVLHATGAALSTDVVFAQAKLFFSSETIDLDASIERFRSGNGSRKSVVDPYCKMQRGDVELSGPFDCLRDIEIGSQHRRAIFVSDPSCNWPGDIPALLLDAAWRVGAMYASPENRLFVPTHIRRMVVPVGMEACSTFASGWEIRSTAPKTDDRVVRWTRTEVLDKQGTPYLIVEDASATRLR